MPARCLDLSPDPDSSTRGAQFFWKPLVSVRFFSSLGCFSPVPRGRYLPGWCPEHGPPTSSLFCAQAPSNENLVKTWHRFLHAFRACRFRGLFSSLHFPSPYGASRLLVGPLAPHPFSDERSLPCPPLLQQVAPMRPLCSAVFPTSCFGVFRPVHPVGKVVPKLGLCYSNGDPLLRCAMLRYLPHGQGSTIACGHKNGSPPLCSA